MWLAVGGKISEIIASTISFNLPSNVFSVGVACTSQNLVSIFVVSEEIVSRFPHVSRARPLMGASKLFVFVSTFARVASVARPVPPPPHPLDEIASNGQIETTSPICPLM